MAKNDQDVRLGLDKPLLKKHSGPRLKKMGRLRGRHVVIVINTILCVAFLFGLLAFFLAGKPYVRGFYCNDQTISKPFIHSTIPSVTLVIISVAMLVVAILVIEFTIHYTERKPKSTNGKGGCVSRTIKHPVFRRFVEVFAAYVLCVGAQQFAVDIGKYTVGRLRPHFLSICNPDYSKFNCTNPDGTDAYIVGDQYCRWTVGGKYPKDSRLSFPSGHSSMAAFTAVFLILYIESEFRAGGSLNRIPKVFIESAIGMLGFGCAVSRISDYKHHPMDVIVGSLIGIVVACMAAFWVLRLRFQRVVAPPTPSTVTVECGDISASTTTDGLQST